MHSSPSASFFTFSGVRPKSSPCEPFFTPTVVEGLVEKARVGMALAKTATVAVGVKVPAPRVGLAAVVKVAVVTAAAVTVVKVAVGKES